MTILSWRAHSVARLYVLSSGIEQAAEKTYFVIPGEARNLSFTSSN